MRYLELQDFNAAQWSAVTDKINGSSLKTTPDKVINKKHHWDLY